MTIFFALILSVLVLTPFAYAQDLEPPFGVNNAFASSRANTSTWLDDLGVTWISDHLARRSIERLNGKGLRYEFAEAIGPLITEYAVEHPSNAWFVVNVESKFPFTDGRQITFGPSTGKYVPAGPVSLDAYAAFLDQLVRFVNGQVPGWKARYWSVDNEHASLYVPAFCGATIEPVCAADAARAYADLVERSSQVIRGLDPEAKIVFGGVGGGTPASELDLYYRAALLELAARSPDGFFDFFDYHDFNTFKMYQRSSRKRTIEFFRALLADTGFPGKPILVKAGGTHSGMDLASANRRLRKLQSEKEQAEHLVKRLVHHAANGVKLTLWGTIREDEVGEEENSTEIFRQNGLVYNGRTRYPTCNPATELPCPDPGNGVIKLSFFTLKHLLERASPLDWRSVETLVTGTRNVYGFRLGRIDDGRSATFAWWDYFEDTAASKTITLSGLAAAEVTVTELLPSANSGVDVVDYSTAFPISVQPVTGGSVTITLGKVPVLIEE
jgi:hypothetical protein